MKNITANTAAILGYILVIAAIIIDGKSCSS